MWFPFATDPTFAWAMVFVVAFGAITFPLLFFISAPYGRHMREGWGPSMPSRWAWILMEAPSPIGFALVFLTADDPWQPVPLLLAAMWLTHYVYRSFIYPFRVRGGDKPKPVLTASMAFLFNCANGPMNAYAVTRLGDHLSLSWLTDPRFIVGVALFVAGYAINHQSDAILRNLRKPGESGYKIPHGGFYRWISCPNYFGEMVEWLGFALAAWTPAGAAFALFTFANLFPRAVTHHKWYREKFPDYPTSRRAVLPFVV